LDQALVDMNDQEIAGIKGVGKAISGKIRELLDNGEMQTLEKYKAMTPEGVQEMLNIKGFGPKKILTIWKELEVETIGELLYAVNENRLIELKGFGKKTQEDLKQKLEYYQKSKHKFHYATLEGEALDLIEVIEELLPDVRVEWTGAIRRRCNEVEVIELLVASDQSLDILFERGILSDLNKEGNKIHATNQNEYPVLIYTCSKEEFGSKQFRYTAAADFMEAFLQAYPSIDFKGLAEEQAIFAKAEIDYIEPEMREQAWALDLAKAQNLPTLVEKEDIKGVIHSHTTYSDGLNTLEEMVEAAKELGYQYIGITDHSKSAFYANGLKPDRVLEQMQAIDALNAKMNDFTILKGIESDILNDGSLDYEEDILKQFDFIIASVHSNLRMDEEKATNRIIKAVENPYTSILGHPTGRLLLSRQGYPIDHKKIIDACAENGVSIELNANPYRLDLDWTWIPYATEKGVLISINPDAHSTQGILDIHYGVLSARKGGLTKEQCLNAYSVEDFLKNLKK
jgi:DNA polymerase (family 10)